MAGKLPKMLKRGCDTPQRAFGAVITELRLKRGWTYHAVAHKVGCTPGYMNEMEHGKRNPSFSLIKAIADLHKLKLSQLIARAERKHANCSRKKD